MKQLTVYNRKGEKKVIRPNEVWMHGKYGVIKINEIARRNNAKWTTQVHFETLKGTEYVTDTSDDGGEWNTHLNVLFKIS